MTRIKHISKTRVYLSHVGLKTNKRTLDNRLRRPQFSEVICQNKMNQQLILHHLRKIQKNRESI